MIFYSITFQLRGHYLSKSRDWIKLVLVDQDHRVLPRHMPALPQEKRGSHEEDLERNSHEDL